MRTARPQPSGFAAKARDLQALRDAVDQAATVSGALWITYLGVFFYLAIAASAVTHKDLFFENPVKLPFLGVELPLTWFFVLGPLLFLIVHAYTLLHFAMLAGKVGAFHTELEAAVPLHSNREDLRRQLPSNIFVQFLAGPRDVRGGATGFLLRLIAWISLILGPIALLMLFQLQFLPYQAEAVSWGQRIAVLIDVILLWVLWPRIARIPAAGLLRRYYHVVLRVVGLTALSLLSLLLVTVASFRGEWLHDIVPAGPRFVPTSFTKIGPEWWEKIRQRQFQDFPWKEMRPVTLYGFLVGGEVDPITQRPKSWWSNRLVLPGIDLRENPKFDTDTKIESRPTTLSLRKRRLEDAVLSGAYLLRADFTGARLDGALLLHASLPMTNFSGARLKRAELDHADLRGTKFSCADPTSEVDKKCTNLQGASLIGAQLQGASLDNAQLQGARLGSAQLQRTSLHQAQLQDASLNDAHLEGAGLDMAHLEGAALNRAHLQGASLNGARLQGARLESAELEGASLSRAYLQGAWLEYAKLQGASLDDAHLEGALLDHAELQGTSLDSTHFQGASLDYAQLQGVSLDRAYLYDASLFGAFVWRAKISQRGATGAYFQKLVTEPKYRGLRCDSYTCKWSADSYAVLRQRIIDSAPMERQPKALVRIANLDLGTEPEAQAEFWEELKKNRPSENDYYKRLGIMLRVIGCTTDGAPYIIKGLFRRLQEYPYSWDDRERFRLFVSDRTQASELAAAFLDEETCPGSRGLSEMDKMRLQEIRYQISPSPFAR